MSKNFIQGAIKKPGQLHTDLGVPPGQTIPAGLLAQAAAQSGKVGQRARFAQTLKGLNHGKTRPKQKKKHALAKAAAGKLVDPDGIPNNGDEYRLVRGRKTPA